MPRSGARSLRGPLTQLGVLAVVLGGVEMALYPTRPDVPFGVAVLITLTGWVYIAAGAVAWARRPSNQVGPLLCAGGIVWLLAALANTGQPALVAVGLAASTIAVAIVLHVLLAFPSGRLRDRASRVLSAGAYLTTTVLQAPHYLFSDPTGVGLNPLLIAERPDLVSLGSAVNSIVAAAVILAVGVVLTSRLRAAAPAARRMLAPLFVYGVGAAVTVSFAANLLRVVEIDPFVVFIVQIVVLAGIPVAFAAAMLLGGFARTAQIEDLAEWLGSADRGRQELGPALARTLGDPTLTLLFRLEGDGWVDGEGRGAYPTDDRGAVTVHLGDRPVGLILYDTTLLPDAEVVRAAGRVVAIAVERERLTLQLLAGQEQLRDSRTRLVEAGDRERRSLAHDLHDRLQGRLVTLALHAGTLEPEGPPEDIERIRHDLDEVITELRLVVQGVMPNLLIERGLTAAVRDMAERSPLRTVLDLEDGAGGARLPPSIEGTAYYVVAEALTNAVKHAGASDLRISLRRRAGTLRIEIVDDGVGGATASGGAGLRGIGDRVDALGGFLEIDSPPAAGTRLVVEIPCES